MTKQIDIQELIPFMKDGYVFMEKNGDWKFSKTKPQIIGVRCLDGVFCKCWDRGYDLEQAFNIAPVEDWTKSLIKVGDNDEKK